MKIVIVEDEVRIRDGLRYLLSKMGSQYRVVAEACTGKEGLQLILEKRPDLVITDVRMDDMNGLEMLEALKDKHVETKSIILSAYSEFAYAQQAVRLSVNEYLLKPVNAGDFISAVQRVEALLAQAQENQNPRELEIICEDLVTGRTQWSEPLAKSLSERFGITRQTKVMLVAAYMGNDYDRFPTVYELIKKEREHQQVSNNLLIRWEAEKTLFMAFYEEEMTEKRGRTVCQNLLRNRELFTQCSVGYYFCDDFCNLKDGCTLLRSIMDWNITLGDFSALDYSKIRQIKTVLRLYPNDSEKALRIAMCNRNQEGIEKAVITFFEGLWPDVQNACTPGQAKEFTARLLWLMINTGKELGLFEISALDRHTLFEQVRWAKTRTELIAIAMKIGGEMRFWQTAHLQDNVLITKAIDMIRSYYHEGITQDEIALKLGVTQEYLSTSFHKSMGISFSHYLRDLRIQKAKEMLIGTNLRQWEIATRIGYTDGKYFSKVFKECTGMLPTDYRRKNQ